LGGEAGLFLCRSRATRGVQEPVAECSDGLLGREYHHPAPATLFAQNIVGVEHPAAASVANGFQHTGRDHVAHAPRPDAQTPGNLACLQG